MPEYQVLTFLAAFAFLYSLVADRLERTAVNGALVFVVIGMICGPAGLKLIDLDVDAEGIRFLAELTLAVVLFTDSANANLRVLRKFEAIPVRMLLIGLPLTILAGFAVGVLIFPDMNWFELALLGTMLAPTDAALGKAVVTNQQVPTFVRESLNVESGLNDGICVPVLLLFLSLAGGETNGWETLGLVALLPLQAIGIGALIGVLLGSAGSLALRFCSRQGWTGGEWLQIPVVALAVLCFAFAQWWGGSGFIASFVGGMTFGALTREHKEQVLQSAKGTGDALAMLTWLPFGTLMFFPPFAEFEWRVLLYAVASLTVVRIVPIMLSVTGLGLRWDTRLFLGWFGPRGLASIVFAVMVLNHELAGESTLIATAAWTILLSVFMHGLLANRLASVYGRRVGNVSI